MLLTFCLAVIGWIIFRAESIGQAWKYVCGMCNWSLLSIPQNGSTKMIPIAGMIVLMIFVEWIQRNKQHCLELRNLQWYIRYIIYASFVVFIIFFYNQAETFIYFQF